MRLKQYEKVENLNKTTEPTTKELKAKLYKAETERGVMIEEYDKVKEQRDKLLEALKILILVKDDGGNLLDNFKELIKQVEDYKK